MYSGSILAYAVQPAARANTGGYGFGLATVGGGKALGLAVMIGNIERGKWADLTCIDLRHFRSRPLYDPISQLVYAATSLQVGDTWVAGRHVVENGMLTQVDGAEILCRTSEWQERIAAHAGA
jgi:5-methylthioadenosine/S-adenosylhomocysteine deaminase